MASLTLALVDFLLSERGRAALEALCASGFAEQDHLRVVESLRRNHTLEEAAALVDQALLRRRAVIKFPQASRMLFVDEALQQASSRLVAQYHAALFSPFESVADLGCGIGGDTLALAEAGLSVLALERDPVRAALAAANMAACGVAERVQVRCADWTQLDLDVPAAFVDPSRRIVTGRAEAQRVFSLHAMLPPLAQVLELVARVPAVAVKVSPGVDLAEVPPTAQVEFVSERDELKEALLRFGKLRSDPHRLATLLPGPFHLAADRPEPACSLSAPAAYLYEPDPAILRAGLVRHLAERLGAAQLDPDIAYLTADHATATPFARVWGVTRHGPFNLKLLNVWLRELGAGNITVKKRGSPVDTEAFRRRLKTLPGGPALTVFLTHVSGKPWMIVAPGAPLALSATGA